MALEETVSLWIEFLTIFFFLCKPVQMHLQEGKWSNFCMHEGHISG